MFKLASTMSLALIHDDMGWYLLRTNGYIQPVVQIGDVGIRWLPHLHRHVENPDATLAPGASGINDHEGCTNSEDS